MKCAQDIQVGLIHVAGTAFMLQRCREYVPERPARGYVLATLWAILHLHAQALLDAITTKAVQTLPRWRDQKFEAA